ncbi:MAG TPA: PIG-L family deacetylase [Candidatus Ozemobacteraceae bacterium]
MTTPRSLFLLIYLWCAFFSPTIALGTERILVIAPHPDDEVIGLGGWLADRIASGAETWVVFVTDGEDFPKAVRMNRVSRWPIVRASAFLRLGKLRQREGRASLKILGVPPERTWFLGYPTNLLWRLFHSPSPTELLRSKATRQRFGISTWPSGDEQTHPHSRASWAADMDRVLTQARPDIVLLPCPFDTNTDHKAVQRMTTQRLKALALNPSLMCYLVHCDSRRRFPRPLGYHPELPLNPPDGLPPPKRYTPSDLARATKELAARAHKSQIKLRDGFILGFLRSNEIFWPSTLNQLPSAADPQYRPSNPDAPEGDPLPK